MRTGIIVLLLSAALLAGCVAPGGGPVPTPSATPTPNTTYTPAQLKYLLLDHYGEQGLFYCDPDLYPVGRSDEPARAVAMFPVIRNMTSTFAAIVARKGLLPPYTDATKLLIYREYKKLNAILLEPALDDTYNFSLQMGVRGPGQQVTGVIRTDGVILSERSIQAVLTCPICLAAGTLIGAPSGPVKVEDIRAGTTVWTMGRDGTRKAAPVIRTVRVRVPTPHPIVHLLLSDGRELFVSPGHPTMDGRAVGALTAGDRLDGAPVAATDLVQDSGEFTYDILPAGDTGGYWANGIPLESTLFSPARSPS